MKKIFIFLICFVMAGTVAHAQGLSSFEDEDVSTEEDGEVPAKEDKELVPERLEDKIFWTKEVNTGEEWGIWMKEYYKPYADDMTLAMLKIVASTAGIDFTGKSSEEILEEVNAAYNKSLRSMELIKHPPEFNAYHSKVIELYKKTINADPNDKEQNAIEIEQLTREADEAMAKALFLHMVPLRIIRYINEN